MKRFLIFALLIGALVLQEALLRNWQLTGLVPNLLLVFILYLLFYRFKHSQYLVLAGGWFLDIHSTASFGIFIFSLILVWLGLAWYRYKFIRQVNWWHKLNFLLFGSLGYSFLIWLLLSWSYLNWQSFSLGIIKPSLVAIVFGVVIWFILDYFKARYWRDEELRISI